MCVNGEPFFIIPLSYVLSNVHFAFNFFFEFSISLCQWSLAHQRGEARKRERDEEKMRRCKVTVKAVRCYIESRINRHGNVRAVLYSQFFANRVTTERTFLCWRTLTGQFCNVFSLRFLSHFLSLSLPLSTHLLFVFSNVIFHINILSKRERVNENLLWPYFVVSILLLQFASATHVKSGKKEPFDIPFIYYARCRIYYIRCVLTTYFLTSIPL